ncbi:uncharacterized protein LOC111343813 [Stylophora pistillata]|uniref:uncharacterized protein LOC111343813 n=1 Tax=Stylophora pistillata TaxID=50429 RepID=UPI000C04F61F|nr:uncharacterized protein LOC111343813 [Stylophora pistillata]
MSVSGTLQEIPVREKCRTLVFKSQKAFNGRHLMNHVIRIVEIMVKEFCTMLCYMEPDCVSINLDDTAGVNGKYKCELNNVTHEGHEHEFKWHPNYFYHASQSACVKNPCENNSTCQSGFTDLGYRCLCTAGFKGQTCAEDIDSVPREHKPAVRMLCVAIPKVPTNVHAKLDTTEMEISATRVLCSLRSFSEQSLIMFRNRRVPL